MTTPLQSIAISGTETDAQALTYLSSIPPEVAAIIRRLKVVLSLAGALRWMATAQDLTQLERAAPRASAFMVSALIYGDLGESEYDTVAAFVRALENDRRAELIG